MHDTAFADAARPARVTILGLPLRDYSLGHETLLLKEHNPLLASVEFFNELNPEQKAAAILRAVLICHRSWLGNQSSMRWIRLWSWWQARGDYAREIEQFRAYRAVGCLFPPSPDELASAIAVKETPKESGGRYFGSPLIARLYAFVCSLPQSEIRLHGDCAWDFPFGLATFLQFSESEARGERKIENADEAAEYSALQKNFAEMEAAK